MEIIESISIWTKELNPIIQGVIGSAIFSLLIYVGRVIYKLINDLSKTRKKRRQESDIIKIILHKRFVNSNGMYYFTQGYLLVIFKALYHLIYGLIICLIGLFLSELSNTLFFNLVGIYLGVQKLLTGLSWLSTEWSDKDLTKYDSSLVEEITNSFISNDPFKGNK